jgi:hypothetical protein
MRSADRAVQAAGAWLTAASLLMMITLGFHGPLAPDLLEQMATIAGAGVRWPLVHWIAALSLTLYAVGGLIMLTSRSRLTDGSWTLSAWAVLCVGSLYTAITATAEATAMAQAAVSGNEGMFAAWWAFAQGMGNGFAFFALGVAAVAVGEARAFEGAMPPSVAWLGVAAAIGSFSVWALGRWLEIAPGNLLWVVSSLAMSAWLLWFGLALARHHPAAEPRVAQRPRHGAERAGVVSGE